ncbi:MAG: DUF3592 domain-containing protein [Gammaproteobacteria bacterium]|nr:DUF3592 domain-containing protein [Gammaproteobacteria bacterium]
MMLLRLLVPTLFMAIALIFLFKGYEHGNRSYQLLQGSLSTSGVIIEVVPYLSQSAGKSSSLQHFPEVKYTTTAGDEVIFTSGVTSRADHYKPGDKVRVLYREDDTGNAVIGSFSALWAIALIFLASGVMLSLIAGWFFGHAFKADKKTD